MKRMKFGVIGAGFWSGFQIPGWLESGQAELVAVCDIDESKAKEMAQKFGVKPYESAEEMLQQEELDFVDIITNVETHFEFVELAASYKVDIVCQKPLTMNYQEAKRLLELLEDSPVRLFVNENFRRQNQIRKVKSVMDSGVIGQVFKGRVSFCSAFPVFDNQPFLKELDRFILTDVGSHILDVCRFLFGEAHSLLCLTGSVNPEINGEDVANVLMQMDNGIHCFAEMSYASLYEKEAFPQTLMLIEGDKGSIKLDNDFEVKVTTQEGTICERIEFEMYDWADPEYAVVHSSIVHTQKNILQGLMGGHSETEVHDNFETVKLVWASYASAEQGRLIKLAEF